MKKLMILFAATMILSSCSVGLYSDGVHTSTVASLNLSMQPSWGPAGYHDAPYYYFPEFDFYYDVNKAIFYYLNHGRWIAAKHLPPHFPKDLHRYYKVVLTQRNPWLHNHNHRAMYKKYKGVYNQPVIGNKHHPQGPGANGPHNPQRPSQNTRYDHNKTHQNNGHYGGSYYGSRNNQYYDNRNTVRDSRNNNTNRGSAYNNGANGSQRGNGSNSSYNKPSNQDQSNKVAPSNNRGSNNSRSQQAQTSSSEKKNSSTAQRGGSSSQGTRSTGSRGR